MKTLEEMYEISFMMNHVSFIKKKGSLKINDMVNVMDFMNKLNELTQNLFPFTLSLMSIS